MMKKAIVRAKKVLSVVLTAAMVVMTVPESGLAASAAEGYAGDIAGTESSGGEIPETGTEEKESLETGTQKRETPEEMVETAETEPEEREIPETQAQETEIPETKIQETEIQETEIGGDGQTESTEGTSPETEAQTESGSDVEDQLETETGEATETEILEERVYEASEDFERDGTKLIKYTGNDTQVVIPEGIEVIGNGAFKNNTVIRSVTFPGSVVTIENDAFWGCTGLADITLNNGLKTIGRSAFENAPLGTKVDGEAVGTLKVPGTVSKIGYRAFKNCAYLCEVVFENGDGTESSLVLEDGDGVYIYDRGVFSDCQNLKKVTFPDRLERIGGAAFKGNCINLEEVVFGKNLREIGDCAFRGCTSLKAVHLPENVETIGIRAFLDCTSLTDVTLNKGLRTIALSAFENVPLGRKEKGEIIGGTLVMPGSVIEIGYRAFMNCGCLKELIFEDGSASSLVIHDSISGALNRKDWGAFAGCVNLKSVRLPNRLKRVGSGAFYGCTSLEEVTFGESLTQIGQDAFGECNALRAVNLPDNVETIEDEAFVNCTSLTELTLNKGIWTIGRRAFENAPLGTKENGVKLVIPGSVTKIGHRAFRGCLYLGEIVFEDGTNNTLELEDGQDTQEERGVFSGCENLKKVALPERLGVIGIGAFYECKNIEEVTFGKNLREIRKCAFMGCASLRALNLPDNTEIIGDEAFSGCTNLADVTLNSGLESIGKSAFKSVPFGTKDNPGKISVPGAVKNVYAGVFGECTYLQEVVFENGSASEITLHNWGYGMFQFGVFNQCPELKSIVFPDRMEIIKDRTVAGCPKLETVYIPEHVSVIEDNAFVNCGTFTILGKTGSAAQEYADKHDNITFRDINNLDTKVTGVSVSPDKITKTAEEVGTKVQLTVTVEPAWAADKSVKYQTSDEKVAAVDEKGEVTITGAGSADITVTANDGGLTAVCHVSVTKEEGGEKPQVTRIPRVTITQKAINLYEKDGEGTVRIKTTAEIESIEYTPKASSGARLEKKANLDDGKGFTFKAVGTDKNNYKKASAQGTLTIKFAGGAYADYKKAITLSTNKNIPAVEAVPVRAVLYPDYQDRESTAITFRNKASRSKVTAADGYEFRLSTSAPKGVNVSTGETVVVRLSREANKSSALTFQVTNAKWHAGIKTTAKCTIKKGVKPEMGFSNSNAVLNTNYINKPFGIVLSIRNSSDPETINDIKVTGKNNNSQKALANGDLSFLPDNGSIQVSVSNSGCKKAKYTYTVTGKTADGIDVAGTLTISVATAKPSVSYKRLGGSIDILDREGTCFKFRPVIKNYVNTPDAISAMVLTGADSDKFDFEYDEKDNIVSVRARAGAVFDTLTTYKPTLRIALSNGEILENKISMKVKQAAPKVTASQAQITLKESAAGTENGQVIALTPNKDYAEIETVTLAKEDDTFGCQYLDEGNINIFVKDNPSKRVNKTYSMKLNVTFKDSVKSAKPVSVTVKVNYKN